MAKVVDITDKLSFDERSIGDYRSGSAVQVLWPYIGIWR